jgi:hypothetical protein
MLQPPLLLLPDIGLHTLGVQFLSFLKLGNTNSMALGAGGEVTGQREEMVDLRNELVRNLRPPVSNGGGVMARQGTHGVTALMLVGASFTLLEVLIPTAMRGRVRNALGTAQTCLTSELYRHVARRFGQIFLASGFGRHDEVAERCEMS